MAIVKRSDIVRSGQCEVPYDRYSARIKKASAGESKSSGNPMLTFDMELLAPAPIQIGDGKYDINGMEFNIRQPYHDNDGIGKILDFNAKLGLPEEFNTEAPNTTQYEGLVIDLLLKAEKQVKRKAPTEAQKKAGQGGDPIKDAAGKEVSLGYQVQCWMTDVLGLSPLHISGGASSPNAPATSAPTDGTPKRPY